MLTASPSPSTDALSHVGIRLRTHPHSVRAQRGGPTEPEPCLPDPDSAEGLGILAQT